MVRTFAFPGCKSTSGLHAFPSDPHMARRWLRMVGRALNSNAGAMRVCNLHFSRECYENYREVDSGFVSLRHLRLTPDAVPSPAEYLPFSGPPRVCREVACQTEPAAGETENGGECGEPSMDCDSPDFAPSILPSSQSTRETRHKRKRLQCPEAKSTATIPTADLHAAAAPPLSPDVGELVTRKEMDKLNLKYSRLSQDHEALKAELEATREENERLRERLKGSRFGFDTIKDEEPKISLYTGLRSLQVFIWLLNIVKRNTVVLRAGLSWEDHLLLVLMRLRHGFTDGYLAFKFGLPLCATSEIMREWIPMLSFTLRPLIIWPSREAAKADWPKCFTPRFKDCRCIIHRVDISVERNRNLKAETSFNYKHQNTVKYLVGITPAGAISFLSDGWGSHIADKSAFNSGFLAKLERGDVVLAERRLLGREELAGIGATLRIPRLTKGQSWSPGSCAATSRKLSRVCVHMKRVVGQLKAFHILNTVVPISQVDLLDNIVALCAGLINIKRTVVPERW